MGSSIAFAAAIAALSAQSAPPLAAPISLAPAGQWTVDYADAMCVLTRQFGKGAQQVTIGFRPGPLSDNMRLGLLLPDASDKVTRGTAQLQLDGAPAIEAPFARGRTKIEGLHIIAIDTSREKTAALNKAKTLRVTAGELSVELKLSATGVAMRALETCEKDLLVGWGMDAAVLASIASYPKPQKATGSFFSTDDYPREAVIKKEQGMTGVRFWVSKEGKLSDCQVAETSGSAALDAQTCSIIMRRARYEPARTKAGEAVASIAFQRIRWEMPE